ncbi:hypothetical protein [Aquimarina sp. RZ0]|uniref:hypothetical protein n=1 Tax=Aquimarina sp. RZ0 TaxID=2607730 RepID=UPI0011F37DBC|nr:hypothetical protein [Aquimarina sp. RZ0]KAA1245048.1 hypothetical protein F0000_13640 [Aquimarina sp. RZ0]
MRKSTTQTISISVQYDMVFEYISNPLTQKEWAINFIKDVKKVDNSFIAITPFGEIPLAFKSDKEMGIIDIILGGGEPIPTRLIKNNGGCEYVFTLFQPKEMPDSVWENEGIPGLIEELKALKSILERK